MNEVFANAGVAHEGAHSAINFPSGDGAPGGNSLLHSFHADVASLTHHIEDFPHFFRGSFANKTRPGNVVVDGARRVFFRPDIQQDKIAFANPCRVSCAGLVMRVPLLALTATMGGSSVPKFSRW